jgi:ribosomal protein L44E
VVKPGAVATVRPSRGREFAWIVRRTADWIEARDRGGARAAEELLTCTRTGRQTLQCDCPQCREKHDRALARLREKGLL